MSAFDDLKKFISEEMAMAQVYQPVMLIELLKNGGQATVEQIAKSILDHDPTQIEYYSSVVKNMVGKVLTNNRGITTKEGNEYHLKFANDLSDNEVQELISICQDKVRQFEEKRDGSHWEHRRRGRRVISGSVRYEVLKRARFRCELCGITADKKSLEVDHIHPKSLGGKDDLSNYQALCYTCNSQKNNKDDTDFRGLAAECECREVGCLFCDIQDNQQARILQENAVAYVIRDAFAVAEHHTLIIPKRHVKDYFALSQAEINGINRLIISEKSTLDKLDPSIDGYNIGMNCGETAGQTIFHCHIHLIPRRKGDVPNPRGGVRHVIPEKGFY